MHNYSETKLREICRYIGAWLLLLAPVFSYPLNLLHLVKKTVPYWHLAEAVTQEAMTCLAIGMIISEPERLKRFFQCSKLHKAFLLLLAGLLLLVPIRMAIYGGTIAFALQESFYPLTIAAGIVLSKEIRRIIIPALSFWGIIAVFFTLKEFVLGGRWWTGFCGNWNWNFALLATVLPATLFWFPKLKKAWFAVGISLLFPVISCFSSWELFPRGVILGIITAVIYLTFQHKLKLVPLKKKISLVIILLGTCIAFLYSPTAIQASDCRPHLWRSAWKVFCDAPVTGTGSRITSHLTANLPPEYFACNHQAEFHPHPHNEIFHQMAYAGIPGLILLPCALLLMLQRKHNTPLLKLIDYVVIVLLIHGCFDVTLSTKIPGMLFWVMLGVTIAGNIHFKNTISIPKHYYYAIRVAGLAAFILTAMLCYQASNFFRNGKVLLSQNKTSPAIKELNAGGKLPFFPISGYYLNARINLFDEHNNSKALQHLNKLSAIGLPDMERSNELRGLILENLHRPEEALNAHLRELAIFPFNIRSAVLANDIARRYNIPEKKDTQEHLKRMLAARKLTFDDLQKPLDCDKINLTPAKMPQHSEDGDTMVRRQMGNAFFSIILTVLCLSSMYGIGFILLKNHNSAALTLAIGIPIFSVLSLLIHPLPQMLKIIIISATGISGIYAISKYLKSIPIQIFTTAFIITLCITGSALLPPFGWDEQIYQIALPFHQYGVIADNPYSAYPALLRWINQLGCQVAGLNFPRLAIAFLWPLLLLDVYNIMKRQNCSEFIAVCGILLLSLSSLSVIVIREANSEIWQMIFVTGATYLLLENSKFTSKHKLCLGWCLGGVIAVKFTGIIPASAILLLIIIIPEWRKNLLHFTAAFTMLIVIFTMPCFIILHNPCYPYLSGIFGTSSEVEKFHHALAYDRFGNHGITGYFSNWLLPIIKPERFDGVTYSPALLLLGLVCVFCVIKKIREGNKKTAILLSSAGLTAYTVWFLCGSQTRFVLPCLGTIIILTAVLLKKIYPKLLIPVFSGATLIILCNISFTEMRPHYKHFQAAWKQLSHGRLNPMQFLKQATGDQDYFRTVQFCQTLPKSSKILLLSEKRTLYLPNFCSIGDVPFQSVNLYPVPQNEEEFIQKIKPFTHLYLGNAKREIDANVSALRNREKMQSFTMNLVRKGVLKVKFATSSTLIAEISPGSTDKIQPSITAEREATSCRQ